MTTAAQLDADELIALATEHYYEGHAPRLYADVEEQVVHPACDDRGITGVRIRRGEIGVSWEEGWYSPVRPFCPY